MFGIELGLYFDTYILIGMFLAFLMNCFFHFLTSYSDDKSLLLTSAVMALSYYTSNHFFPLESSEWLYFSFIAYDLVTIFAIVALHKILKYELGITAKYVMVGMAVNAILCFIIHMDLRTFNNQERWWFWSFYTIAINTIDVLMVAALITGRDYLRAGKLWNYIWCIKPDSVKEP